VNSNETDTMEKEKVVDQDDTTGTVSMMEVLQDEQDFEEDAAAVLGSSSDTECSHSKGYVARQPLYACLDCSKERESCGFCLACSYHCHEGHNLVELYTKRMFRCDCGTPRLGNKCKLSQVGKQEDCSLNKYNQNFKGLYCVCYRPYPDPDETVPDCMIQCILCEDWYHGRHLGREGGPPEDGLYSEMICRGCVTLHPFLLHYLKLDVTQENQVVDVENKTESDKIGKDKTDASLEITGNGVGKTEDNKELDKEQCQLKIPLPSGTVGPSSLFLPSGWRTNLCNCSSCVKMYEDRKISFLPKETDTVHYYESQAQKAPDVMEKGMEALGQLDRVKQVEAIHSYNNMKDNLMEYLSKFADNKKVVREEDIKTFFEGMKANKKMRTDPPPSCR